MARSLTASLIILTFIITGCYDSACYTKLEEVDSLTENDLTDSACKVINMIEKTYHIKEGKEKAYYSLLKYQLQFRNRHKSSNSNIDSNLIDYSISYYKEHIDNRKLALSYYLKSRMSEDKDAIEYLKKAEYYAEETKDYFLKTRICGTIAIININNEDYNTALKYGLKSVKYGKNANDEDILLQYTSNLSTIYSNLGMHDSCLYYANKCLAHLKKAPTQQKASIYLNVAAAIVRTDTTKAKEYAWKSIEIEPTNNAYQILAKIARDGKDYNLSEKYLNEALKYYKSVDWEAFILHELAETKELMGEYEEANILSKRVIKLRDSVEYLRAQDSIKEKQIAAELENKRVTEIKAKDNNTLMITAALTVIIIAVVAAYIVKRRKHMKKMDCAEKEIEEFRHGIKKIEKEKLLEEEKVRKIEAEKRRMQKLIAKQEAETERQKQLLIERNRTGHNIYNKVKEGTAAVSFDKEKMSCLLAYYETIAPDFRNNTDAKYKNISEYQYVILIMKDMKLSNRQIATVLGITDNAVRTQMSRINKNAKE